MEDAAGCEWVSDSLSVFEPPEIKFTLPGTVEAALGDSVYLQMETTVTPGTIDTIIWIPLIDSAAAGKPYQRFLPLQSGKIAAIVLDSNGCAARAEVLLQINRKRRVFIPNVFNPESTQNQKFFIQGGSDVEVVASFDLYDRWGDRIFSVRDVAPNDPANGWDGSIRGKSAPPGAYVYHAVLIFKDGEKSNYSGSVTLLR